MIEKLLEEFNNFFAPKAKVVVIEDRMEITIDGKTMVISLPQVYGWQGAIKDSSWDV